MTKYAEVKVFETKQASGHYFIACSSLYACFNEVSQEMLPGMLHWLISEAFPLSTETGGPGDVFSNLMKESWPII